MPKKLSSFIFILFFLSFLVVYVAQSTGYYENLNYRKTYLTEEKIKEFEKNVEAGKKINPEDYLIEEYKDYSNKISNFGLKSSLFIEKHFKKYMNKLFGELSESTK